MLCKSTGEIQYASDMAGVNDIPEEAYHSEDWIEIPHKNDLNLGSRLVTRFVADRIPEELGRVRAMFRRRGAYSRYKSFLARRGLLDAWHEYENAREEKALREWCRHNKIEIVDDRQQSSGAPET